MNTKKIIRLMPPLLSDNHIKEKVTCIRAHRERIFQVKTEYKQGKLLCSNYGQGGAGWTFLFGCVHESIRQFEMEVQRNPLLKNKPIAVIGAGCYGLLTANMLAYKGYEVRIIAKELYDIPSHKAAGFFFPRWRKSSTPEEKEIFLSRGMKSYQTMLEIIKGRHPFIKKGPKPLPAYYAKYIDPGYGPYQEQNLIKAPENVIIDFGNGKTYDVMQYKTIFINSAEIMNELERNRKAFGITISQAKINSLDEIQEPTIFNCAGMGAKEFTDEKRIVPVQGHLITLKNQPIDELQYMINVKVTMQKPWLRDELIYFAPKETGILGITFKRGEPDPAANTHEFDRLLTRCRDFFGDESTNSRHSSQASATLKSL